MSPWPQMHVSHVVVGNVDVTESLHVVQLASGWSQHSLSILGITCVNIDSSGRYCIYDGGRVQSFPESGQRSAQIPPGPGDVGGVLLHGRAATLLIGHQLTEISSHPGYTARNM